MLDKYRIKDEHEVAVLHLGAQHGVMDFDSAHDNVQINLVARKCA